MGKILPTRMSRNLNKIVEEAMAIEAREAKEAGALGYMGRAFVQATMPHKKVSGNEFVRTNGLFKLVMLAPSDVGLPYGSLPRLITAWITTEAVRTKSRELVLGRSLSDFMRQLDLVPTGGRWGSITRLRDQMKRLFSASISCTYGHSGGMAGINMQVVEKYDLWWKPKQPNQSTLWESTVTLSQAFFDEITEHPVPLDMRALKALRRSPLALDMYSWLTYRMSYLRHETAIPWVALQKQFGSSYAEDAKGLKNFKQAFKREMRKVLCVFGDARVNYESQDLILYPSKPHIRK